MIENKSSQNLLYSENDKQSEIEPTIGKIDYLDTKGNIVKTINGRWKIDFSSER